MLEAVTETEVSLVFVCAVEYRVPGALHDGKGGMAVQIEDSTSESTRADPHICTAYVIRSFSGSFGFLLEVS